MHIERLDRGLLIRTPAKLNLFLEVLSKRADGYHEIDTVMCPVTLFDELRFEPTESAGIEFVISSSPQSISLGTLDIASSGSVTDDAAWHIPNDQSNLVVRALRAVQAELGRSPGCRVQLLKKIPAAAGMGGGSSDAAAAIVAGLIGWGNWDRRAALRIASGLGSDIPLFLGDERNGIGLAQATGRGERVEILSGRPALCFAISHPPVGLSTAAIYRQWKPGEEICSSNDMLAACAEQTGGQAPHKQVHKIEGLLFNALQPAACRLTDWIDHQLRCFRALGKPQAMMTGSGSACFALACDLAEGQRLAEKMIQLGLPRAYAAQAWYAAPIEQQLDRIA